MNPSTTEPNDREPEAWDEDAPLPQMTPQPYVDKGVQDE